MSSVALVSQSPVAPTASVCGPPTEFLRTEPPVSLDVFGEGDLLERTLHESRIWHFDGRWVLVTRVATPRSEELGRGRLWISGATDSGVLDVEAGRFTSTGARVLLAHDADYLFFTTADRIERVTIVGLVAAGSLATDLASALDLSLGPPVADAATLAHGAQLLALGGLLSFDPPGVLRRSIRVTGLSADGARTFACDDTSDTAVTFDSATGALLSGKGPSCRPPEGQSPRPELPLTVTTNKLTATASNLDHGVRVRFGARGSAAPSTVELFAGDDPMSDAERVASLGGAPYWGGVELRWVGEAHVLYRDRWTPPRVFDARTGEGRARYVSAAAMARLAERGAPPDLEEALASLIPNQADFANAPIGFADCAP
ncbi:MAG: hypothetical protein U0271_30230 [Polyangiaceae bacterium]